MNTDPNYAKIEELRKMEGVKSSRPDLPVDIVVQEAVDLQEWCKKDRDALVQAGLDWKYAEELTVRALALSKLEAEWTAEYNGWKEFRKEWKAALKSGRELRSEMAHHFYSAFDSIPGARVKIRRMSTGRSNADVIQGLFELAVFGNLNPNELKEVGVDPVILDKAKQTSASLSKLLARLNSTIRGGSDNQILRNKAYFHLKEAIDEVRRFGKLVFWKNKARYKGYVSDFMKRKKQKQTLKSKDRAKP
jgi:hypothetical protein